MTFNAVLGIVVAYLPRLERGKIVRADDLVFDTMLLVVKAYLLESFQLDVLRCFSVRV